jgi:hypothetical protein
MHAEQPYIHRHGHLLGNVACFGYVKPISPSILQLAKTHIPKFHFAGSFFVQTSTSRIGAVGVQPDY